MKKANKPLLIYNILGTILCALAGAIVGFLSGGFFLSLLGASVGVGVALFLKKRILPVYF